MIYRLRKLFNTFVIYCIILNDFFGNALEQDYIPKDWVDPGDMRYYDIQNKVMKPRKSDPRGNVQYNCSEDKDEIKRYNIFIERMINHLLEVSKLKDVNASETNLSSELIMKISPEKLSTLINFGKQFSSQNLTALDQIMSTIFTREYRFPIGLSFFLDLFYHFYDAKEVLTVPIMAIVFICTMWMFSTGRSISRTYSLPLVIFFTFALAWNWWYMYEALTATIMVIIFFCTMWMFATGQSISRIFCFLLLIFFTFGLAWNWWHMYQEACIKQYVEIKKYSDIPDDCVSVNKSYMSYFKSLFITTNDCEKYYKAHNIHPISRVKPTEVFSETFFSLITHPLKKIGLAIREFCTELSDGMPWPFNILIYPLMVVCIMLFLLCASCLCYQRNIKIWSYFGGISIENSSQYRVPPNVHESSGNVAALRTPTALTLTPHCNPTNCCTLVSNVHDEEYNMPFKPGTLRIAKKHYLIKKRRIITKNAKIKQK